MGEPERFQRAGSRYIAEHEQRGLRDIERRGVRTTRDQWHTSGRDKTGLIEACTPAHLQLPPFLPQIVRPALVTELRDILNALAEMNEGFVGQTFAEARVILDGNEDVQALIARLSEWMRGYVDARLSKPNVRDNGSEVRRFDRLYQELLPTLEEIAFSNANMFSVVMESPCDFLAYELYRRTWKHLVSITFSTSAISINFDAALTDDERQRCAQLIELYMWHYEPGWDSLWSDLRAVTLHPSSQSIPTEVLRRSLGAMAEDIAEMRPLLIKNFKSEKTVRELTPEWWSAWHWAMAQSVGSLALNRSERDALVGIARGFFLHQVFVGYDGLLSPQGLPWLRTGAASSIDAACALTINHEIVRRIHELLFSFYDQIDLDAFMGRRVPEVAGEAAVAPDEPPGLETVAASCQAFLATEEPQAEEADSPHIRRVAKVRLQPLLRLLSDRLGCQVRDGKGSEVDLYRRGGKHFRLGRHRRNDYVPAVIVGQILRRLGITTAEWLDVIR